MTGHHPLPEIVAGIEELRTVRRGNLRATVVALRDGSVCLYSPVEKTSGALGDGNPIRFLLAPNHYHNKGISEHVETFGDADLVCSEAARPRLEKLTGQEFGSLSTLAEALPPTVELVEPEGLKTGEVWMIVRSKSDVVWIVTDAFCGTMEKDEATAQVGFLKTFPKYGLKDKVRFSDWVSARLEKETPTMIIPCHGEIVRGTDMRNQIPTLLETL